MEERWQIIGIVVRKGKTGAKWTTLHLVGQHDKYSVENAEVCHGSRVLTETTSAELPAVQVGDTVELLYAKGFEDKAVLRSVLVVEKNPMVNNNAKK